MLLIRHTCRQWCKGGSSERERGLLVVREHGHGLQQHGQAHEETEKNTHVVLVSKDSKECDDEVQKNHTGPGGRERLALDVGEMDAQQDEAAEERRPNVKEEVRSEREDCAPTKLVVIVDEVLVIVVARVPNEPGADAVAVVAVAPLLKRVGHVANTEKNRQEGHEEHVVLDEPRERQPASLLLLCHVGWSVGVCAATRGTSTVLTFPSH